MGYGNTTAVEKQERKEAEDHDYAMRSLYGTLGDKGFQKDEIRIILKNLALDKGQWSIARVSTEDLIELHAFVNSTINFKKYLKVR